ncbi:MAG: D-alanyl-D-alanine carboxypeptidase family protein [bacterium]
MKISKFLLLGMSLTAVCLLPVATFAKGTKAKANPSSLEEVNNEVRARSALLVDALTGQVLFERNSNLPLSPASTVKLMTSLLVYERMGMNGSAVILPEDVRVEASCVPLRIGEKVSVSDLMHAMLIGSDNDCAMALARIVAGSVENFVVMMDLRAKELGCLNTSFANPNGLPDSKPQHTTAHDMLLIFQKFLSIPELNQIAQMPTFTLRTRVGSQIVRNHNKLLGKYPGMGPAKTGWTRASRHTYAAAVARNGRELRLIILNSPNKWDDSKMLFDYGFAHLPELPAQKQIVKVDAKTDRQHTTE